MIPVVLVEGPLHGVAVALPGPDATFVSPLDGLEYRPMLIAGTEPPLYVGLIDTMNGGNLDAWTNGRIMSALAAHRQAWRE